MGERSVRGIAKAGRAAMRAKVGRLVQVESPEPSKQSYRAPAKADDLLTSGRAKPKGRGRKRTHIGSEDNFRVADQD